MPLFPPQDFRSTEQTHRQGLDADKPNAADVLVGTLYFATDTLVLERSNGTIWENYSAGGGVGPPGPTGAQGGAGAPGLDGEQGEAGDFFPIPGPAGATGIAGAVGLTGPPGIDGEQGEDGEQGPIGPAGSMGATGPEGSTGPMGPIGFDGEDGADGPIGPPGAAGIAGAAGVAGAQGLIGPPGVDGADPDEPLMMPGPPGTTGAAGADGTTQIILTDFTEDLGVSNRQGEFDITGLSGLVAGDNVLVIQTKQAISSKGDATDEPDMDLIRATGIVIDATTVRVTWWAPSVVVGIYAFAYVLGGGAITLPSVVQGDLLYGSAVNVISTLAKDTNASRYLSNQGASNNPAWNQVNLPDGVTGTLPDANLSANVPLLDTFNQFSEVQSISGPGAPLLILGDTSEGVDFKYWALYGAGGDMNLIFLTDGFGALSNIINASRGGGILTLGADYLTDLGSGWLRWPGTQNPSSDVNVLDDYEEGTWTPALTFGGGSTGITYTVQEGGYTKIGRQVFCTGLLTLSNKGSSTGIAEITLPFADGGGNDSYFGCPVGVTGMNATEVGLTGGNGLGAIMRVYFMNAGVLTICTEVEFTNTSGIFLNFQYQAAT